MKTNAKQFAILVVDDEPTNLTLMVHILQEKYNVKVARDGEKALEITFSDHPPDLVLLDVVMPGIDGFEVCRQLKKNLATLQIPVIFLTGDRKSVV